MASTINGTSTGNGGLISTGDDSGILNIQTNETTAVTIDASQMVGIGTTTPKVRLAGKVLSINGTDSGASYQASIELLVNGASAGELWANSNDFVIGSYSTQPMIFRTQNTERMRIVSGGGVRIGGSFTSGASKFAVNNTNNASGDQNTVFELGSNCNNTSSYHLICVSGGADKLYIFGNGNVQNVNNSYGALSDVKLKENIVDATPKLANLMQVKVRNYNLKSDPTHKQIGVIAQELEQIFPAMVEETPDRDIDGNDLGTTTKAVKYSVFVPMLIKAIQELKAINDTQAETLTQQTEAINALTARILALEEK